MSISRKDTPLSRRDFLRMAAALGGMTALSSMIGSCSQDDVIPSAESSPQSTQTATPSPTIVPEQTATASLGQGETQDVSSSPKLTPTEAAGLGTSGVAFVKTEDRVEGVRRAIELLGINPVEGKRVFLKPNFNSSDPAPGSTHPELLRSLVVRLKVMGAEAITVGDRSGMGDTRRVMEAIGVFELAQELGFETMVFDELTADDWVMIEPSASHWGMGFPFARPCLEAESLVQVCCLKTHRYGGHFTMSLKNSVGMVAKRNLRQNHDFMTELHNSGHQRRMIAEINTAYTPDFVVMDAVEAFISGGPAQGERVSPQVIIAGGDRVAIDAVGIALLRQHGCKTEVSKGLIFQQEQIARAVELGLGVDRPDKIEFLTDDADSTAYAEQVKAVLMAG
jgi:uncharacterized protein (DUF362 family)